MVYHLLLFKLLENSGEEKREEMMMQTRMQLLKIPEVLNVRCGKRIEEDNEWPFFIAIECESMDKLAQYRSDPVHIKFLEETLKPNTVEWVCLNYEMEPGKDIRYS